MNRTVFRAAVSAALAVCLTVLSGDLRGAEEGKAMASKAKAGPIKVVILVGGHPYDAKNFDKAWGGHDDIACEVYKDARKPWAIFDDVGEFKYDVILMYTLMGGMSEAQRANLQALLKKGVGLVVWHHALGNCQDWPEFEKIAGGRFWMQDGTRFDGTQQKRSGTGGGTLKMHIEAPDHPITKGMKDFEIRDETYNRQTFTKEIKVLVSCDHPRSDKPIAWVSNYPGMRIFAYQGGHDVKAWVNPGHRRLMAQGIRWAAGRLGDQAPATRPAAQTDPKPEAAK